MKPKFKIHKLYSLLHSKTNYAIEITQKYQLQVSPFNQQLQSQFFMLTTSIFHYSTQRYLTPSRDSIALKHSSFAWIFTQTQHQTYLISTIEKNKCLYLNVSKGKLMLSPDPQEWVIKEINNNEMLRCSCFLMHKDKVVDLADSTEHLGAQFLLWEPHYMKNQRFLLHRTGDVYIIKNYKSKYNLNVKNGKYEDETMVVQWPGQGTDNQLWILEENAKEKYRICCYYNQEYELAVDGHHLIIQKGRVFLWDIIKYTM